MRLVPIDKAFRHLPGYSLKVLLIMVTLINVVLAIIAAKYRDKTRERAAVAEIQSEGGFVAYDWQVSSAWARSASEVRGPPGPRWLRAILGDDFFAAVVLVHLQPRERGSVTGLECLDDLPDVADIRLNYLAITDDGVIRIVMHPLRRLVLRHVLLPRDQLKILARTALQCEVHVWKCNISDQDLRFKN